MDPVEPAQGLYGGDPGKPLVDVHGVEQRLVETGLELVSDDEDSVLVGVEGGCCLGVRCAIHVALCVVHAVDCDGVCERDKRFEVVLAVPDPLIHSESVLDGVLPR